MRQFVLLMLIAAAAFGQQPVHVEPPVFVTAIDVVADVRDASGKLPAGLIPADFILLEDGVERKVIAVESLRDERASSGAAADAGTPVDPAQRQRLWQTVVYFESELSNAMGRQQAARELMKHADVLARMGTVDVIFAAPGPKALLRSSRDPEAIREALKGIATSSQGVNRLAAGRREYLGEIHSISSVADIKRNSPPPTRREYGAQPQPMTEWGKTMENPRGVSGKTVRPYVEIEMQLIKRFRSNLLGWLSQYRRHVPRALIMVTDGFDVDPLEFYASNLIAGDEMELRSYVATSDLGASAQKMAETLASTGWIAISLPSDNGGDGWVDDASTSGIGRAHGAATKASAGRKGTKAFLYRPLEPLLWLADDTSGSVVSNPAKLGQAIERLDERLRITYQVDRKPDGKPRKLELRSNKAGLQLHSARWASSSTPDEMAEARALSLLTEGAFAGELPVESTIEWSPAPGRRKGMLRLAANMDILKSAGPIGERGDFRLTMAIRVPERGAFVTNHLLNGVKLDKGVFRLNTPVDFPEGTSVVAVVVEDVISSVWGSSRVEAP